MVAIFFLTATQNVVELYDSRDKHLIGSRISVLQLTSFPFVAIDCLTGAILEHFGGDKITVFNYMEKDDGGNQVSTNSGIE